MDRESGKCMVFPLTSSTMKAGQPQERDNRWRIENHESECHYVVDELVPYIRHVAGMANGHDQGHYDLRRIHGRHARRELFTTAVPTCLTAASPSPDCTTTRSFSATTATSWCTPTAPVCTCRTCPTTTIQRASTTAKKSLIVCGQGAWGEPLLESTRWLDTVLLPEGHPHPV